MGATLKVYTEVGSGADSTGGATCAKLLAQRLVSDISWFSVDTTTSDTTTSFDQTLAISWDSDLKLRIYNSYSQYYMQVKYMGERVESSDANCPYWYSTSSTNMVTSYIVYGNNFVFFGKQGDSQSCFIGQINNYYDEHTASTYTKDMLNTSNYGWVFAASTVTQYGNYINYDCFKTAFLEPYTTWGEGGHLYGAVPLGFRRALTTAPVIGFCGGTDSFYKLFDNGSTLDIADYSQFSINGHTFFTVGKSKGTLGFRIS